MKKEVSLMKHGKFSITFSFVWMLIVSTVLFVACTPKLPTEAEPPFAQRFTGVVGSFDESDNLAAVLLFPESEQAEGRINLKNAPELNITFQYTISKEGDITFAFDTEDTASGTLHGKDIAVTATVNGQTLEFKGTFYLLTEKIDGEVTEEGYVVAGHPFSDVITPPDETKTLTVNGMQMTVETFLTATMPARDTIVEIVTESEN